MIIWLQINGELHQCHVSDPLWQDKFIRLHAKRNELSGMLAMDMPNGEYLQLSAKLSAEMAQASDECVAAGAYRICEGSPCSQK